MGLSLHVWAERFRSFDHPRGGATEVVRAVIAHRDPACWLAALGEPAGPGTIDQGEADVRTEVRCHYCDDDGTAWSWRVSYHAATKDPPTGPHSRRKRGRAVIRPPSLF